MSENSIGLKTRVLEGLLEETLGQRYYAISSGVTLCYAGSGQDNNQRDFKQIGFLDITPSRKTVCRFSLPNKTRLPWFAKSQRRFFVLLNCSRTKRGANILICSRYAPAASVCRWDLR
jgi:hypothetical protein